MNSILLAGVLLVVLPALIFGQQNVKVEIYNGRNGSFFATSSTLVSSGGVLEPELILFDAQFSIKDGRKLLKKIKRSRKRLKQIILTAGDPDFYFGLQPIVEAYPDVQILSSARTAKRIRQTKDAKLKLWGPILKHEAPTKLYEPQITHQTTFIIGHEIIEMRCSDEYAAYLWMPRSKVIFGGVGVFWNMHLFVAVARSKEIRESWRETLGEMLELEPDVVIPGHFLGEFPLRGNKAIIFTLNYLETFEKVLEQNDYRNSTSVIGAMKEAYPELDHVSSLEFSAKVITGEMQFER